MKRTWTSLAALAALAGVAIAAGWLMTAPVSAQDTASEEEATIAALKTAIADMEERVTRLKDTDAIENLISAYGYYLDKAMWDHVADLFAEDGQIEISQRGIYVGKESIRRSLELYGPQMLEHGHLHNHIQLQPLITIADDGQTAHVRSRGLSQLGTYGETGVWGDGVYENTFVKEDGVWKIKVDHVYTTFFSTYDEGFAAGARPAPQMSEEIPPDMPPSVRYKAFPDMFVPPYHYEHPVTGEPIVIPPTRGRPEEAE